MADTIDLKPEDFLMREGEASDSMYYVKSGTLAIYKRKGGAEKQIGTIYAGELVGEMSFLDSQPRSASVKAIQESEVVEIPRVKFNKFLEGQPSWFRALLETLLDRLRRANTRIKIDI